MKYINFNKVSIQNFLSVGPESVEVDFSTGIHIITGINKDKQDRRNGVGKSTVADAIHFAIFGNTIRDLKKENIVNNVIGSGCCVTLQFDVIHNDIKTEYKVVRMLEPSRCLLYINGEDSTRDSIANTTDYICKLVDTTQDIFQNCVIMTVNNTIPFMGKKKIEKRKFIEGIFNLEVFSDMLSALRQDYNEVKKTLDVEIARYEEVEKTLTATKQKKENFIRKQEERYNKLITRKEDNTDELERLRQKVFTTDKTELDDILSTIKSIEGNLEACDEKMGSINKEISKCETEIIYDENALNKIGTGDDTCPVCLKSISTHDRSDIECEKEKITDIISEKRIKLDDHRASLNTIIDLKDRLKEAQTNQNTLYNTHTLNIQSCKNNEKRITQLEVWNSELDKDLQNFDKETDEFDVSVSECQDRLNELQEIIDKIKHKLSILDVVKFIVSEEGVKSYIVKKILQVFNSKLSYYLQKMDANCCCIFNEYFEDEIVDEKGKMCSYYNFSGAERKNIDLACLFAFMDIRRLQGSVAYNFSVYDELLDTSLDESGVDLVLNILRERVEKYDECIMVISHRKESIKIGSHYKNPGEVIYLEKENGITRRVDFNE